MDEGKFYLVQTIDLSKHGLILFLSQTELLCWIV